ncbi:MAG: lipid-A-disaccharide synthase [Thermodesulfovibrionales bacterium]|nr:lipid-A-disaccharide synthase [Thermodesulfovibrionales bacterium]
MIISGESSGELYGALLAQSLKSLYPQIKIKGVGGSRMHDSGVELISTIESAFGISEAFSLYKKILNTYRKVIATLKDFNPQVLILIDYPDFNIRVAKKAKELKIKILYYVSPQVWAWRSSRIETLREIIDKMAVILPFEEEIYNKVGIPCEFVGHPAMDEISDVVYKLQYSPSHIGSSELKQRARLELNIDSKRPLIALLPGSRSHEIRSLLPILKDVITELLKRDRNYQFIIPIAPNLDGRNLFLFNSLREINCDCHLIEGQAIKSLIASDIAVIASGTATLQAALIGIPFLTIYKLSPLSYLIGRLFVRLKHFSLVNILLDKTLNIDESLRIRELLQREVTKDNIIEEILRLNDDEYNKKIQSLLTKIRNLFLNKNASMRVAKLTGELLGI